MSRTFHCGGMKRCGKCAETGVCIFTKERPGAVILSSEGRLPAYDGGDGGALGFAVDIGTTTVAVSLYDLPACGLLANIGRLNGNARFGADVLSRIAYANERGVHVLQGDLVAQLQEMFGAALEQAGASARDVRRLVITGNTTMQHILMGLDPRGIGVSPFTPVSLFGEALDAGEVFPVFAGAELYLPRGIGAYVGADVTCGLIATGLVTGEDRRLLVDVGTNGEMALWAGGRLLCCATAAGPAFEGASISTGMTAADGAIHRVADEPDGSLRCITLGGVPAIGICGTGLISAVGALLRTGRIESSGSLDNGAETIELTPGVSLTRQDIRELQLAKAAIAAGIDTLLDSAGLKVSELSELLLAGGFGSFILPPEAAAVGLIPPELPGRTRAAGNTALTGAAMLLMDKALRRESEALAQAATELSLSASPVFMDAYIEHMMFPEE